LSTGALACGESVEPVDDGRLAIDWNIRPHGCEASGVEKIRADLTFKGGARKETFDCQQKKAVVGDLRPANYEIRLYGIDAAGDETFQAGPERVTVYGGEQNDAPQMHLTGSPSRLAVTWRFANGRVCGSNGIDEVELTLYDTGDYKVREHEASCTAGETRLEGLAPGNYLIELQANGEETAFSGFSKVRTRRGKTADSEVLLEKVDQ
jgi:hypothetical protein